MSRLEPLYASFISTNARWRMNQLLMNKSGQADLRYLPTLQDQGQWIAQVFTLVMIRGEGRVRLFTAYTFESTNS